MSYRAMASAVAETLDERGIEEVHILGHSMGGKVAMAFALAYPDRVGSLVVVDIAPRSYPAYHQDIIDTMRQVPVSTLTARNQADGYLAQGISDRGVRAFLMKNLVKAEDGTGYQWRLNLPIIDEQYAEISSWPEPDARYTGPVLFVAGGRSPYLKDATPEEMHRLFPEAAIETIPEAGHWVHAEARERFLEVVGAFIARHVEGPVERPEH
jgi:esterase